jgi:hypothetical protein
MDDVINKNTQLRKTKQDKTDLSCTQTLNRHNSVENSEQQVTLARRLAFARMFSGKNPNRRPRKDSTAQNVPIGTYKTL